MTTVHVTRITNGDVFGHTTDHCDPSGCAGDEHYFSDLIAAECERGGISELPDPDVQCECGAWLGERCAWSGPKSDTVLVEWMPVYVRGSHIAAGYRSLADANCGAVRLTVNRECADAQLSIDGDWTRIVD